MNSINRRIVPVDRAVVQLSPLIKGGTTGTTALHLLSHGKRDNRGQQGHSPHIALFLCRGTTDPKKALFEVTRNCAQKACCSEKGGQQEMGAELHPEVAAPRTVRCSEKAGTGPWIGNPLLPARKPLSAKANRQRAFQITPLWLHRGNFREAISPGGFNAQKLRPKDR